MKSPELDELKKSEARFRAMFEDAPDAIFIADADGVLIDANASGCELLERERRELIGKAIEGVFRPTERTRFRASRKLMEKGEPLFGEWTLVRKDGSPVWVELRAKTLSDRSVQIFAREISERKRAEEQSLLIKYTIDHVADSAAQIAPDARFIFVNDAFCRSLGYAREELLKLTVFDIDPNFPKEIWAEHWNNLRARKSMTFESTHRRKDGSTFPIELSLSVFEYNNQEYSFAFGRDLTEIKRAENELHEKQQLLQSIIDNSSALIHVQDLNNCALVANRSFAELLHLSPEQMLGKTDYELWQMSPVTESDPQPEIETYRAFDAEALNAGNGSLEKVLSIPLVGSGRRYFLTTKSLLRDDAGEPHSICTIATEITERKRAEDELRANQQLLQAVFDNTPAVINVKDLDGRFLMINRSLEETLKVSRENLLGKNIYDLWKTSPAMKDETTENVETSRAFDLEVIAAGKAVQREDVSLTGGEERSHLMTKCPLYDAEGKPYAVLTIVTDTTESKRAEKELRRLQTELAHAARVMTMGALTTSIAHEVNQPLAGVITNGNAALRWLAQEPPDLDEVRVAVERIIRDGNRAGEVIAHTRELLKNNAPQKSALDINEIARETIALAQLEIQKCGIRLQTKFSQELPFVAGDKIQLQQVMLNLLMNSIDALKAAASEDRKHLLIKTEKYEANEILIAVKDSGPGLDKKNLERIFEAFYTTKAEGMGMGLSISRSIVEAHGGRLWAIANKDKGATFQFTLPVGAEEQ
jgi:PAS domain S-box-containing protein